MHTISMSICKVIYLFAKFFKVTLTTVVALTKGTWHSANLIYHLQWSILQEIVYVWEYCPLNLLWLGSQHCIWPLTCSVWLKAYIFLLCFFVVVVKSFLALQTWCPIFHPQCRIQFIICQVAGSSQAARYMSNFQSDSTLVFQSTLIIRIRSVEPGSQMVSSRFFFSPSLERGDDFWKTCPIFPLFGSSRDQPTMQRSERLTWRI